MNTMPAEKPGNPAAPAKKQRKLVDYSKRRNDGEQKKPKQPARVRRKKASVMDGTEKTRRVDRATHIIDAMRISQQSTQQQDQGYNSSDSEMSSRFPSFSSIDASLPELMEKVAQDEKNPDERVEFLFRIESKEERESRKAHRKLHSEELLDFRRSVSLPSSIANNNTCGNGNSNNNNNGNSSNNGSKPRKSITEQPRSPKSQRNFVWKEVQESYKEQARRSSSATMSSFKELKNIASDHGPRSSRRRGTTNRRRRSSAAEKSQRNFVWDEVPPYRPPTQSQRAKSCQESSRSLGAVPVYRN